MMNIVQKRILRSVLCIAFSMILLCGCKKGNTSGKDVCSKEEYVERITAYKEYYEKIENDYYTVNGAILVHENGSPYMVLCCICSSEEEMDEYKIMLVDYENGKAVINGEKVFYGEEDEYGGYRSCDVDIAFVDDRCVLKMEINAGEGGTEYWEFEKGNLVAQKIGDEENREKVDEINRSGYVYDIAEKPFVYLYSYGKGKVVGHSQDVDSYGEKIYGTKVTIYDEESDIESVNKIVVPRLYNYMQLTDEQKEYFGFPKKKEDGTEILVSEVANIYSSKVWMPLSYHRWMNGVSFKQCLNELIDEPVYHIEDLMIKELNFDWYNKYSVNMTQIAEDGKKEELNKIFECMYKPNPYSTDEELLETYYTYIKDTIKNVDAKKVANECKNIDIATIMSMDNAFAEVLKTLLKEDYLFTSEKFYGATWKDIVYNGSTSYPTLTITKNGNTLTVPVIEDLELKEAVDAYLAYGCAEWYAIEFVYIDEDNTPELIRRYKGREWQMYTYKNGVVTELKYDEIKDSSEWQLVEYGTKDNKIILEAYNIELGRRTLKIQDGKFVNYYENPNNNQSNNDDEELKKAMEEYAGIVATSKYEAEQDCYDYYGATLIYLDEDDIPELIVNKYYYGVHSYPYTAILTYKDGKVMEIVGIDYINGYIPKTGIYIGESWYEERDEEGNRWLESKEEICSMDGSATENVSKDLFVKIEYYNDFETALANLK